jgi:hypothetical protein
MSSHLVRTMAIVAAALVGMVNNSTAGGGSFTRGCAGRDLQILMMLEQRESTHGLAAQELNETLITIVDARMVCYEGRVLDALEIYDNIARSITSGSNATGRKE